MGIPSLTLLCALCFTHFAPAAERPNIVINIAEDMGYSDIGCYGAEIRTPNIDALARGGIRITNYYVNNMCAVTRASLMPGHYPGKARTNWMNEQKEARK